jgi:hypothetical protein
MAKKKRFQKSQSPEVNSFLFNNNAVLLLTSKIILFFLETKSEMGGNSEENPLL